MSFGGHAPWMSGLVLYLHGWMDTVPNNGAFILSLGKSLGPPTPLWTLVLKGLSTMLFYQACKISMSGFWEVLQMWPGEAEDQMFPSGFSRFAKYEVDSVSMAIGHPDKPLWKWHPGSGFWVWFRECNYWIDPTYCGAFCNHAIILHLTCVIFPPKQMYGLFLKMDVKLSSEDQGVQKRTSEVITCQPVNLNFKRF